MAESLEANDIGNVFHKTMQELYGPEGRTVTRADLQAMLKGDRIRGTVRRYILEALHTFELSGRNILSEDLVCSFVRKTVERDLELLESQGRDGIEILGLELRRETEIGGFRFLGFSGRLDRVVPGQVRVVDYKTGRVTDEDFLITEANAEAVVEKLFGPDNGKRPKIALQLYLYDRFISGYDKVRGCDIVNSIYGTSRLFVHPVENVALNGRFLSLMSERLDALLAEIADPSVPFRRTDDARTCQCCDFKNICGR